MRQIRGGLDDLGFSSDRVLKHGSKRVVYGIPLARNFREILLGFESRPKYIIHQTHPKNKSQRIAEFWRMRWLLPRINRDEVIEKVSQNSLSYPVDHGARVILPSDDEDQMAFDF